MGSENTEATMISSGLIGFLFSVSRVDYSCAENAAFCPLGSQELSGLTRHP